MGPNSGLGNGFMLTLRGLAVTPSMCVHSLGVLLCPALLLDAQVVAVAREAFYQL